MNKIKRLVYGVGINDAPGESNIKSILSDGSIKYTSCRIYTKWADMLRRCYDEKFQNKHKSYIGTIVCEEWLYFSKFKFWVLSQQWEGLDLDKDILVKNNKIYSPETCCFVPAMINRAFSKHHNIKLSQGVRNVGENKFRAVYLTKRLGTFLSVEEAHKAWQKAKIDDSIILVKEYSRLKCCRQDVLKSLNNIILEIKEDLEKGRITSRFIADVL